jgi:ATP-dependent helicase HrpB
MGSLVQDWPCFDRAHLLECLEDWLGPYLAPVTRLSQLAQIKVLDALRGRLSWDQLQQLEHLLPDRVEGPLRRQTPR